MREGALYERNELNCVWYLIGFGWIIFNDYTLWHMCSWLTGAPTMMALSHSGFNTGKNERLPTHLCVSAYLTHNKQVAIWVYKPAPFLRCWSYRTFTAKQIMLISNCTYEDPSAGKNQPFMLTFLDLPFPNFEFKPQLILKDPHQFRVQNLSPRVYWYQIRFLASRIL